MPSKTVLVGSSIGLHPPPPAIIAEAAVESGVPVTLSVDGGEPVDAGSALMIMTLGAGNGAQVTVSSDDAAALASVAGLVGEGWWPRISTPDAPSRHAEKALLTPSSPP